MKFYVSCKFFMKEIGAKCLTNINFTFGRKDLNKIVIEQSLENFDAMINRLIRPLDRIGLSIERSLITNDVYYVRLSEIEKVSKWSNHVKKTEKTYKKLSSEIIFKLFTPYIFEDDKTIEKQFKKIKISLMRTDNWITQMDKDRNEEMLKSMTIQNQKEFIPYI